MKSNLTIERDQLLLLNTFALVAQLRSFTQAGNQLGISASAVSQQMRKLETQVGVRLLQRNSRQVSMTEAGEQLLNDSVPLLAQIQLALQRVQATHDEASGLLRINTSRLAAGLLINPRINEFLARYPKIQLELFTDDSFADIVRDGFDAGIRLGAFLERDMVSLPLDQGQFEVVVASPSYWEKHGMPQTPADLAQHDCIRFRLPGSKRFVPWTFIVQGQEVQVQCTGRLIFSDDIYVTRAACEGYGVAHKFVGSIETELTSGSLVPALQSFERPWSGFHIYYPARKLMPPKLRVFIDFLREPLMTTAHPKL